RDAVPRHRHTRRDRGAPRRLPRALGHLVLQRPRRRAFRTGRRTTQGSLICRQQSGAHHRGFWHVGGMKVPALFRRRRVWVPTVWAWLILLVAGGAMGILAVRNISFFLAPNRPLGARL